MGDVSRVWTRRLPTAEIDLLGLKIRVLSWFALSFSVFMLSFIFPGLGLTTFVSVFSRDSSDPKATASVPPKSSVLSARPI